jgi:hypothetical protein
VLAEAGCGELDVEPLIARLRGKVAAVA